MYLTLTAGLGSAQPTAVTCGRPDLIGLGSRAEWGANGAVELGVTLTDAPVDPLTVRPLLFVDGVLQVDAGPLELPCRSEVVWTSPPLTARHALHWTLLPWPPVPPSLAALAFDDAAARYAGREPPGLYPWADVERLTPAGAAPWPTGARAVRPAPSGVLIDDRVALLGSDGAPLDDRLVRVPIGVPLPFRIHYVPSGFGAGSFVATCLLDERQLVALEGRPWRHASVAAGELLEIDGVVELAAPGWHRLHCLLLPDTPAAPDEAGAQAQTWPRPLLALYLWGDP